MIKYTIFIAVLILFISACSHKNERIVSPNCPVKDGWHDALIDRPGKNIHVQVQVSGCSVVRVDSDSIVILDGSMISPNNRINDEGFVMIEDHNHRIHEIEIPLDIWFDSYSSDITTSNDPE